MARTTGVWLSYFRSAIGVLWIFELVLGRWWKLGLTSGLHPGWFGPEAGAELTRLGERAIADGAFPWMQWLLETLILPNAAAWSVAAGVLELAIALSFTLGLFARLFALLALALSFVILNLEPTGIHPFFAMGHLIVLWSGGGTVGLDRLLLARCRRATSAGSRIVTGAINLRILPQRALPLLASACILGGVYHGLQLTQIQAVRLQAAALELAVLLSLAGVGLFAMRERRDPGVVSLDLARIFVGFKLLQSAIVRSDAGLDGIPGLGPTAAVEAAFQDIVTHHFAAVAAFVDGMVLPHLSAWTVGLLLVQGVAGALLLLGWHARLGAILGVGLAAFLVGIGFVRLAPFLLVTLVLLAGAGSGRVFSVDGHGRIRSPGSPAPLPLGLHTTAPLAAIAVVCLLLALIAGLETAGYVTTMPGFSAFFLALPAGTLVVIARLATPRVRDIARSGAGRSGNGTRNGRAPRHPASAGLGATELEGKTSR